MCYLDLCIQLYFFIKDNIKSISEQNLKKINIENIKKKPPVALYLKGRVSKKPKKSKVKKKLQAKSQTFIK